MSNNNFSELVYNKLFERKSVKLKYLFEDDSEPVSDDDILNAASLSTDDDESGNQTEEQMVAEPEDSGEEIEVEKEKTKKEKEKAKSAEEALEDAKDKLGTVNYLTNNSQNSTNVLGIALAAVDASTIISSEIKDCLDLSLVNNNILFEKKINEIDESINKKELDLDSLVNQAIRTLKNFYSLVDIEEVVLKNFQNAIAMTDGIKNRKKMVNDFEKMFNDALGNNTIEPVNYRSAAGGKSSS